MRQVLQSVTILLQSATGITKCDGYYKVRQYMVTFISIEYSEPKILTWNLHHHLPSYLAVLFCLREKLARHVPLLDSPVNFAEQYSSLIAW